MEHWKPVLDYEDYYEISDLGRLRRIVGACGTHAGKIHKPLLARHGYRRYALSVGCKKKYFNAHRLVVEAFLGSIPRNMQVNHKNGKKDDNRLVNLEVCTPSENSLHAIRILKIPHLAPPAMKGSDNHKAKIGESEVRKIRRLYAACELSQQAIANQFGLCQTTVSRIILRQIWSHIGD